MTTNADSNSFEQMSARLEEIVRQLEDGSVSLDDSIKLFEEASNLAKKCRKALDSAQLRVTELQKALADAPPAQDGGSDEDATDAEDEDAQEPDQSDGLLL